MKPNQVNQAQKKTKKKKQKVTNKSGKPQNQKSKNKTPSKNKRQSDLINNAIYRTKMRELNPYDFEDMNEDEINKLKQDLEKKIAAKKLQSNQVQYESQEKLQKNKTDKDMKDKNKKSENQNTVQKINTKKDKVQKNKQKSFKRKPPAKVKDNKNKLNKVNIKTKQQKNTQKDKKQQKNSKQQSSSESEIEFVIKIKPSCENMKKLQEQQDIEDSRQSLIELQSSQKKFMPRKDSSANSVIKLNEGLQPPSMQHDPFNFQESTDFIQTKKDPLSNTNNFFEQFEKSENIPIKNTKKLSINLVKKPEIKKNQNDEINENKSIDLSVIARSPKYKKKDSINKSYFDEKEMLCLLDYGAYISNKDNIDDVSIALTQTDNLEGTTNFKNRISQKLFDRQILQGTMKQNNLAPRESKKNWQSSKLLTPKESNQKLKSSCSGSIMELSYHEQMEDIYEKVEDQLDSLYKSMINQDSLVQDPNKSKNKKKTRRRASRISRQSKIIVSQADNINKKEQSIESNQKILQNDTENIKLSTDKESSFSQKLNEIQNQDPQERDQNDKIFSDTELQQFEQKIEDQQQLLQKNPIKVSYNNQTNKNQEEKQTKKQMKIECTNKFNMKPIISKKQTENNYLFVQNSIKINNKNLQVECQKIFSQQQSIKQVQRNIQSLYLMIYLSKIKKQLYYESKNEQISIKKVKNDIRTLKWQEQVQRNVRQSNNYSYTPKKEKKTKNRQQKFQQYINYQPQYIVINNNNHQKNVLTESSQQDQSYDTTQSKFLISQTQNSISQKTSKSQNNKNKIYCYSPFAKPRQNLSLIDNLNKSVSEYSNYNDYSMEIKKKKDNILSDIFMLIHQYQNKVVYWKDILFSKNSKTILQKLYWSLCYEDKFNQESFENLLKWCNIEVSKNFMKKFLNYFNHCNKNCTDLSQNKFYMLFQVKQSDINTLKIINKTKFQKEIYQENFRIQKRLVKKMLELQFEMFEKISLLKSYMSLEDIQDFMSYFVDNIYYQDFAEVVQKISPLLINKNSRIIFDFLKSEDKICIVEDNFIQLFLFFNNKVKNNQLQSCIKSKPKIINFFFNQTILSIQLSYKVLVNIFIFQQFCLQKEFLIIMNGLKIIFRNIIKQYYCFFIIFFQHFILNFFQQYQSYLQKTYPTFCNKNVQDIIKYF